jgi:hypothetical protein
MPDTDGPIWTLYDRDFKTAMHVLHGWENKLLLKLNDAGSGQLSLPLDDPVVADVEAGRFIALNYRGAYRGGFVIENMDYQHVNPQEYAGRRLMITGRGPMSILKHAIIWDYLTPNYADTTRIFGTGDTTNYYGDGGAPLAKGAMLYHLLTEARDEPVVWARHVWRAGAILAGDPILDWDFTTVTDSTGISPGNDWTDAEDMEFAIGMNFLDIMRQIAALEYDFTMDWDDTNGLFMLHAYKTRIGADLSGSVVFEKGVNILDLSRTVTGANIANGVLIGYPGKYPYADVRDTVSEGIYYRQESILQAANAYTEDTAWAYGNAEMATTKDPKVDHQVRVTDNVAPMAFVDYGLGDTVEIIGDTTEDLRIIGMQLDWKGDNPYAGITLEVE